MVIVDRQQSQESAETEALGSSFRKNTDKIINRRGDELLLLNMSPRLEQP